MCASFDIMNVILSNNNTHLRASTLPAKQKQVNNGKVWVVLNGLVIDATAFLDRVLSLSFPFTQTHTLSDTHFLIV